MYHALSLVGPKKQNLIADKNVYEISSQKGALKNNNPRDISPNNMFHYPVVFYKEMIYLLSTRVQLFDA